MRRGSRAGRRPTCPRRLHACDGGGGVFTSVATGCVRRLKPANEPANASRASQIAADASHSSGSASILVLEGAPEIQHGRRRDARCSRPPTGRHRSSHRRRGQKAQGAQRREKRQARQNEQGGAANRGWSPRASQSSACWISARRDHERRTRSGRRSRCERSAKSSAPRRRNSGAIWPACSRQQQWWRRRRQRQ